MLHSVNPKEYHAKLLVQGKPVTFLIDTGRSSVHPPTCQIHRYIAPAPYPSQEFAYVGMAPRTHHVGLLNYH